LNFADKLQ